MLRKRNGVTERLQPDGSWAVVSELETEIEGLVPAGVVADPEAMARVEAASNPPEPADTQMSQVQDVPLDVGDVPGLLSGEGPRSTAAQRRLQKLRGRKNGRSRVVATAPRKSKAQEVVVPATSAEVSGPDAAGSRLGKTPGRRTPPVKDVPRLLEDRPKWVQELFEAHFRSGLSDSLRRLPSGKSGKNRMKLSRADYAIGWLVMFDKAREDLGILRVKRA